METEKEEVEKGRRGEGLPPVSSSSLLAFSLSRLLPFLISLAVFFVYFQVRSFEFIRFDDHDYTFLCPFVKDGLSWANVKTAFCSFTHAAIWMPLTYISYMLDISLFGPGMGAHHLVNAAIHAVNSALLFCLLSRLIYPTAYAARPPYPLPITSYLLPLTYYLSPLLLTLFWALHPMRVEPVAWIAGRKELLCAFFVLLGLLSVARNKADRKSWQTFLCCLGACMSKPTGMCFPFLALCIAGMAREEVIGNREEVIGKRVKGVWTFLGFVIATVTGAIAVYSQTHAKGYDVRNLFTVPFLDRSLNALKSIGLYIFKTFIPFDLHIDCRWGTSELPADGWGVILAAGTGLVLLMCWFLYSFNSRFPFFPFQRRAQRACPTVSDSLFSGVHGASALPLPSSLLILLFFLFSIAPTLGVFGSFGREARADRFMYIPAMAISVLLVSWWSAKRRPAFLNWVLTFAVLAYLLPTLRLIPTFKNDYTVFSRVLECDPVHPRALSHVASEECARFRDFDSGIRHFRDSLACEWNRDTACQLAFALATRGRTDDMKDIRVLGESTGIAKNPETDRKGLMLEALGMAAIKERRWNEAVVFFAAAIRAPARLYPADDAYARLGVALANGGRHKEAEQVFSALAKPGSGVRESVRTFAERSLERLFSSPNRLMLFY